MKKRRKDYTFLGTWQYRGAEIKVLADLEAIFEQQHPLALAASSSRNRQTYGPFQATCSIGQTPGPKELRTKKPASIKTKEETMKNEKETMKDEQENLNFEQLFSQLLFLFDEERLIRYERRARKNAFFVLEKLLKARRKTLAEGEK